MRLGQEKTERVVQERRAVRQIGFSLTVSAALLLSPAVATASADSTGTSGAKARKTYSAMLGAFPSAEAAKRGWDELRGTVGEILNPLPPRIVRSETGDLRQLRAGSFPDIKAALDFCTELSQRSVGCFVVPNKPGLVEEQPRPSNASADSATAELAGLVEPSEHAPSLPPPAIPASKLGIVAREDKRSLFPEHPEAEPLLPMEGPVPRLNLELLEKTKAVRERVASTSKESPEVLKLSYISVGMPKLPTRRRVQFASAGDLPAVDLPGNDSPLPYENQFGLVPRRQSAEAPSAERTEELVQASETGNRQYTSDEDSVAEGEADAQSRSRLSDDPKPFKTVGDIPERPPLLIEAGDPFLGSGELGEGFELPTGAVWQPRLWVFGTMRSAVQSTDTGDPDRISEWSNRFDAFANLQLTGTEKLLLGIRPLDQNQPDKFSGYVFEPSEQDGYRQDFNYDVRTLFFEGDVGSLFPAADPEGQTWLDFGFTVGRQPLIYQDGILISDTVDAIGVVRNNIRLPGVSNLRVAGAYGWNGFNELTRSAGGIPVVDDENLQMAGIFTEWDTEITTLNVDGIYVWDTDRSEGGDGLYGGISAAQRIGHYNTTFRVNGSLATNEESTLVQDGVLLSSELSWTPHYTNDTLYFNPFVAFGEFIQAARELIDGGGPLAPLGILFASPNIGQYGSELSNRANDVAGFALGYQAFWDNNRRNLAVELAFRDDMGLSSGQTDELDGFRQVGIGAQFQQKIGERVLLQLEAYGVLQEDRDEAYGGRFEILYQF